MWGRPRGEGLAGAAAKESHEDLHPRSTDPVTAARPASMQGSLSPTTSLLTQRQSGSHWGGCER